MDRTEEDFNILERVTSAVAKAPAPQASPKPRPAQKRRMWTLPGICTGTRISTSFGEVPVQLIRPRDQLRTREGNFKRVLRIDEYKLDAEFLAQHPEARPVRFSAKLTGGHGDAIVYVSPGQSILARGADNVEKLRRAGEFVDRPGVLPDVPGPLTYYIFHLGEAALVRAEGMWVALGE